MGVVVALGAGSLLSTGALAGDTRAPYSPPCRAGYDAQRPPRPTARFTFVPNPPQVGEAVTFDGSASERDRTIARYYWDLDGQPGFERIGTERAVTRAYDRAGAVVVRLVVQDTCGATSDMAEAAVSVVVAGTVSARSSTRTATLVRRGIPIAVACATACVVRAALRATRSARRRGVPALVGRSVASLPEGQSRMRIRPTARARRALRRQRRASLMLEAFVVGRGGSSQKVVRRLTVRR